MDISALLSPSDEASASPQAAVPSPRSRPAYEPSSAGSASACGSSIPPGIQPLSNGSSVSTPNPQQSPQKEDRMSVDAVMADVVDEEQPHQSLEQNLDEKEDAEMDESVGLKGKPVAEEDMQAIEELLRVTTTSPYQLNSHIELISLLRRVFLSQDTEEGRRAMLPNLRDAREDVAKMYPVKENLWLDWIADEASLARSIDDRLMVMDVCARAVEDQVASVRLWKAYADYVEAQYLDGISDAKDSTLCPEERATLKETFTFDLVLDTFRQGQEATMKDIADSHMVWDKYRDLVMQDVERSPSPAKLEAVYDIYKTRLSVPHATISDTFAAFSSFVTKYDNDNYESIMVSYNKLYAASSAKYSDREIRELKLKRAREATEASEDPQVEERNKVEELNIWAEYLEWETSQPKKKLDVDIACALYERCVLRFGDQADVWEEYVYFVLEKANATPRVIQLLKRGTRHCPWSGTLWAQYIIALERGFKPFDEVAEAKHLATRTELLDQAGLEELIKVNIAWCGFLQRRAFDRDASDEDMDMAEMGIAEAVTGTGKDDPYYRLQRMQINFYTLAKKLSNARKIWGEIKKLYAHSYEFWLRYYEWELANGSKDMAGQVIRSAVNAKNLDWPEKILETWKSHVEDCGDVIEVESMMVRYRKVSKEIAEKRKIQEQALNAQQAEYAAQLQAVEPETVPDPESAVPAEPSKSIKRRRSNAEPAESTHPAKKAKPESTTIKKADRSAPSNPSAPARDREHLTVIVRNLPPNFPDVKLRQFFRDCGTVNSLKILTEENESSSTATIEFDSKEDVLAAMTKDQKVIDGHTVEVEEGTGATLYVTNFPPTADEAYVRDLFKDCGEIIDIRFPSLKFNTHRRFCYVQFSHPSYAMRASSLTGKQLGDCDSPYTLYAALSAPEQKKARSGAVYEGRELYVRNIDFSASEADVRTLFSPFGKVEKIRLPTGPKKPGQHKGFGFVVFSSKEEAEAAVAAVHGTKLKSRDLHVEIADPKNAAKNRPSVTVVAAGAAKAENASASPTAVKNGEHAKGEGASEKKDTGEKDKNYRHPDFDTIRKKTLGVMNLPDTLNDARLRALFEPYGELRKLVLRPDHQGAIVEYVDVAAAGRASLGMDGRIIDGHKVEIGTLEDLMARKPQKEVGKEKTKGGMFAPRNVAGRGGRGGRSGKSGGDGRGGKATTGENISAGAGAGAGRGSGKKRGLGFSGAFARSHAATSSTSPSASQSQPQPADGEKKNTGGGMSNEDFKKKFFS